MTLKQFVVLKEGKKLAKAKWMGWTLWQLFDILTHSLHLSEHTRPVQLPLVMMLPAIFVPDQGGQFDKEHVFNKTVFSD